MSIEKGKYISIEPFIEKDLAFCIEDPIDNNYNPAYTVKMGEEFSAIIFEFRRAYLALINKSPYILEIEYKNEN